MSSDHTGKPKRSGAGQNKQNGGKRPQGRKRSRGRVIRRTLLLLLIVFLVVPAALFGYSYYNSEVPHPADLRNSQIATIVAADDATVISRMASAEGNRVNVTLDDVPVHVRTAILAAEDRTFYENPGFSVRGFVRAARDNITGREDAGGGSTITQQYVKNTVVGSDRSLERKWRELVLAARMAREWSKDDVLLAYLNTIYFGRNSYGIATAAQSYFGKPLADLTVEEGAVIAAVITRPSALDNANDSDALRARWNYVLDGMVEMNALRPSERSDMVFPTILPFDQVPDPNAATGNEGLIRAQVVRELERVGVDQEALDTRGVRIVTTIDPKAQDAALTAVSDIMTGEPERLRTAVVSIDPQSGAVKAYYGGPQGQGYDFAQAPLQTGSSFKVFGLVAALQEGIPLSARYDSSPVNIGNLRITNVAGESCGVCNIAEALKRSLNTSYYRLTLSMSNGAQKIADAAHAAGIPAEIPGLPGKSLSEDGGAPETGIVLGQYQVRPIDMASAYGTLAASGIYHEPYFVQRVVAADGEVLYERAASEGEQRIEKAVAENATQAMLPIAAYSRGNSLAGGRPSAAKTGTTQLGDTGLNKDAWMVGYTPSLSTAVWVGSENSEAILNRWGSSIYGSTLPSSIWKNTMDGALSGTEVESFPWPDPIAGQAGVPTYEPPAPVQRAPQRQSPSQPSPVSPPQVQIPQLPPPPQFQEVEIFPGIRIPLPVR
ncbi:penicillin-binding protein [Hoyosella rhizosphaerae]|uniref:Penicillin-binding protein 1A n=1 Tax=Hoyosella rhizosphaerae TaxID=1755582 RepID=A0A916U0E6_9ACTN|nr:transglycosylase domain-containing protein [Hoyosella rhizosphaerae]MBN4927041.1 penicillin-binding protein [Hoyosella rhizosphaerae]GGC54509.1 penicillin-binding protein 1A [Hoyosella rhizosphaerae]